MFSIKGVYKDNRIQLDETLKITRRTPVIITVLEDDDSNPITADSFKSDFPETLDLMDDNFDEEPDELSEEDYVKIRKHKRYRAKGHISLVDEETEAENDYPLYDYSAGGLSFIADKPFDVGKTLTAAIKDPIEPDTSVLDFEF